MSKITCSFSRTRAPIAFARASMPCASSSGVSGTSVTLPPRLEAGRGGGRAPGRGHAHTHGYWQVEALPRQSDGVTCCHAPDQLERRLRERLDALGPAPHAALLTVVVFQRAARH